MFRHCGRLQFKSFELPLIKKRVVQLSVRNIITVLYSSVLIICSNNVIIVACGKLKFIKITSIYQTKAFRVNNIDGFYFQLI